MKTLIYLTLLTLGLVLGSHIAEGISKEIRKTQVRQMAKIDQTLSAVE